MSSEYLPKPILDAIEHLSSLPGIGNRSAERLIFTLLRNHSGLDQKIAQSLSVLRSHISECSNCFHFSEELICSICKNVNRDRSTVCIVESPLDLVAIERTHEYKGLYHVLHGIISPINRIRPEDLRIFEFFERIKNSPEVQEIILALPATIEGDTTGMYIIRELKNFFDGKITRLARGIPSGGDLDYLDIGTIGRAILERRDF